MALFLENYTHKKCHEMGIHFLFIFLTIPVLYDENNKTVCVTEYYAEFNFDCL